jgi:hypothetical protein
LTHGSIRVHADEMIELSEQQIIDQLVQKLASAHRDVGVDQISRVVHEEYGRFDGRPIRDPAVRRTERIDG